MAHKLIQKDMDAFCRLVYALRFLVSMHNRNLWILFACAHRHICVNRVQCIDWVLQWILLHVCPPSHRSLAASLHGLTLRETDMNFKMDLISKQQRQIDGVCCVWITLHWGHCCCHRVTYRICFFVGFLFGANANCVLTMLIMCTPSMHLIRISGSERMAIAYIVALTNTA